MTTNLFQTIFRLILEKQTLITSAWKSSSVLLSSFSACQFAFCVLSSIFLLKLGTTALHLSLISGNFYVVLVGNFLFEQKVTHNANDLFNCSLLPFQFHEFYFLSYALSMFGVYIYAIKRTPIALQSLGSAETHELNNTHR